MTRHHRLRIAPVFGLIPLLFIASANLLAQTTPDAFAQNARLGRGGNWGNILYRYSTWDKKTELEQMDLMKGIGLQGLRVNIGPYAHCEQTPPYTLAKDFLERLDWTVNEALKRGFTVIIDQHEYHAMADDPMGKKEMFESTWRQLSEHYKDSPGNVFFGVLNEPNGNLTSYWWNYFLADVVKVIRASNPSRTLVIGPGRWNSIPELANLELPENDRNIIVEIHYYSPHHFTHQGASWSEGSEAWLGTKWGSDDDKLAVEKDFKTAVDWAKSHNRPLYLGEFGAYYKADMDSRVKWLSFVVQQAEKDNITWGLWETMGPGFGIYDPAKKTWIQPMKDALLSAK